MIVMMMAVRLAGVGTSFRFKRQVREINGQTKLAQHIVQYVVVMVA